MQLCSVKESVYFKDIIHEIHRPYGNFYLFDSFVVSEIHEDILFGGREALDIFALLLDFYDGVHRSSNFAYLSNRIHSYALKPVDWLNFKFMGAYLKGYGIIDNRPRGEQSAILEQRFVPCEFKVFNGLSTAIQWSMELENAPVKL